MFEKKFLNSHFLENQMSGKHLQSLSESLVLTGDIPWSARGRGFLSMVDSS